MEGAENHETSCANCQKPGKAACKGCLLVLYCGRECQERHWGRHKESCRSPLLKNTWQPSWVAERRTPAFIGAEKSWLESFGGNKYLWGNVPALDLLNLPRNEGKEYDKELRMLFAASGDLRNVIKTIASVPLGYISPISPFINDLDFGIVARNTIINLLALTVPDKAQAAECMLHVWYSAFIRQGDADLLARHVRPLFEEVNSKIATKPPGTILGKTWKFGSHSCRVELTKEKWQSLLKYLEVPRGLSTEQAHQVRVAVTTAKERRDYRERRMIVQAPAHRLCNIKFREDGILLPFGGSRHAFSIPNPTFFQVAEWSMADSADPIEGWDLREILKSHYGPASSDLYGKLYHHIRDLFLVFLGRLSAFPCNFQLFNTNARELPKRLEGTHFARIEIANITDGGYLGIAQTLIYLAPLLQSPQENRHATFLTFFLNAVAEIHQQTQDENHQRSEIRRAAQYLRTVPGFSEGDPAMVSLLSATPLVRDVDHFFDKYMEMLKFKEVGHHTGMAMKAHHTIVDKWPMRLRLQPGQPGAQEEFDVLHSSGHTGNERYVEWRRTA